MPVAARRTAPATRKPTNVSLDRTLLDQARDLGINVSRACEEGLAAQVKHAREEQWRAENAEAIAGYNAWIEKHGLPLGSLF